MRQSKFVFLLIVVLALLCLVLLPACNLPVKLPAEISQKPTDTSEPPPAAEEVVDALPKAQEEINNTNAAPTPTGDNDFLKFIEGGKFIMGSLENDPDSKPDEQPQHDVYISPFWIYKNEVSNSLYAECVKAGACTPPVVQAEGPSSHYNDPNYKDWPVVGVTWYQAQAYCTYAQARLPTEAEWEKAARGTDAEYYPWGNDEPECDLLVNMEGCKVNRQADEDDTQKVGTYIAGQSPYEVLDMAGNVREWVTDWYADDYYLTASASNPLGPAGPPEHKEKVIRGGGWMDAADDVRSPARFMSLPDKTFEDVGFRCVPIGQPQGAICKVAHPPLCRTPDEPPCDPNKPLKQRDEPKLVVTNLSCPSFRDEIVTLNLSTGSLSAEGVVVTVNGEPWTCRDNPGYPGRLICEGPPLPGNSYAEIEVCLNGAASAGAINTQGLKLVNYGLEKPINSSPVNLAAWPSGLKQMLVTVPTCAEGEVYNSETGLCEQDPNHNPCPENWSLSALRYNCEPDEDGCPEGTVFSTLETGERVCVPVEDDCPEEFQLTALVDNTICEPEINHKDPRCAEGYYWDEESGCCEPFKPDNYGCDETAIFSTVFNHCIPLDQNRCEEGYHFDPVVQGCVEDFTPDGMSTRRLAVENGDDCPPGTELNPDGLRCDPVAGTANNGTPEEPPCQPGYHHDDAGACVPDEGSEENNCGRGYYLLFGHCYPYDEQGCRENEFWDEALKICRPTTGTGSPCNPGFTYNPELLCCEPSPDGLNRCPPEEETPPDEQTPNNMQVRSMVITSVGENYNPDDGLCTPPTETGCLPGYQPGANNICEQIPTGDDCPPNTTPDPQTGLCRLNEGRECPEGSIYDPSNNTCIQTELRMMVIPQCDEDEYYDTQLGYCVQLTSDCCQLGYFWNEQTGVCEPYPIRISAQSCPPGFDLVDGACVQPGGASSCWSTRASVPVCNGPCLAPLVYNRQTGQCVTPEEPEEPEEEPAPCSSYTSEKTCLSKGCSWSGKRCYGTITTPD